MGDMMVFPALFASMLPGTFLLGRFVFKVQSGYSPDDLEIALMILGVSLFISLPIITGLHFGAP